MPVAENTKYSVFFLKLIFIPRTYSPTTVHQDKAVTVKLFKQNTYTVKVM